MGSGCCRGRRIEFGTFAGPRVCRQSQKRRDRTLPLVAHEQRMATRRPSTATRPSTAPVPDRQRRPMQMCNATPGYTNPQYWEQAAKSWEDIPDTFVTDEQMIIRRTLSRHLNLNDHVIDFGCGGGRYLQYLSGRCRRVLGLDISESLIDLATTFVRPKKKLLRRRKSPTLASTAWWRSWVPRFFRMHRRNLYERASLARAADACQYHGADGEPIATGR